MKLVGRDKLIAFQAKHADVKTWIAAWTAEVESAKWTRPQDVKDRYASAKVIDKQTIIFKVKGNTYRLEVHVSYEAEVVSVSRWGTHAEYDRWKS